MLFGLGVPEVAVIVVVALLVLGPDKLPEIARRTGSAYRDVQRLRERLRLDVDSLLDGSDDPAPGASIATAATAAPAHRVTSGRGPTGTSRPARHVAPKQPVRPSGAATVRLGRVEDQEEAS